MEARKLKAPMSPPLVLGVVTSVSRAAQPTSDIDQKNSSSESPEMTANPASKLLPPSSRDL